MPIALIKAIQSRHYTTIAFKAFMQFRARTGQSKT